MHMMWWHQLHNLTAHTRVAVTPHPPSAKHHKWTVLYSSNIYTRVLQICSTIQIIAVVLIYRCWFVFLLTIRKEKLKHERCAVLPSPHSCHGNAHVRAPRRLMRSTWPRPQAAAAPRKLRHLHCYCVVCYVVQCWLFRLVIFPWNWVHRGWRGDLGGDLTVCCGSQL